MRAFVLDGYGAIADHVRLAEIADPVPGPDDVLIEIHAASLNPIDFKLVRGDLKRVSKYQLPRPFGFDAAGFVLSAGARAIRFKPGDAVYARASRETIGTFAEKIALPQEFVALKPAAISHAEAAALPLVGLTTLQGFARVKAQAGQRILIQSTPAPEGSAPLRFNMQGISALTSPPPRVRRMSISSNRWAPTGSLPMTAEIISNRVAITTSSTTHSAARSPSMPSRW